MRYVVLGAGAVGGTIGARVADAGHEVVLVARGTHAEALRADGLRVSTPGRAIVVKADVVERPEELLLRADDVLVLATKTQDSTPLLDAVAGLPVGSSTAADRLPVFCAQNGVANERIALRRFANVYGVVVMMPAEHLEPGRIVAHGTPFSGLLDVGRYPRGIDGAAEQVAGDLGGSGFSSRAVADIMRWKWAKLLLNLGNALEALCGISVPDADADTARAIRRRAREEAVRCYQAAGIDWVPEAEWREHRANQVGYAPVEGRSRAGGSSWQSVARRAGSIEADYLNGEVVLLGRLHGIPTPVNALLRREANALVRGGGAPGDVSVQRLWRLLDCQR